MKKIFVCILVTVLLALSAPVGELAEARGENELVIIAFGDSITAADKWQPRVESRFGVDVINAGVGGDSTKSALARFESQVLDKDPDVVFIGFGTNDAAIDMAKYVPLDEYKSNLNYFIDECEKIGAKVIINIPPPVVDSVYLTRHEAAPFEPYGGPNGLVSVYAQAAREVAIARGVVYADLNAIFKALDDYASYFPDGVHPSNAGYAIYGDTAADAFDKLWKGDVDLSGDVDQTDYVLLKRACFKTYMLDEPEKTRADIDRNGTVDRADYLLLRRICLGTYTVE